MVNRKKNCTVLCAGGEEERLGNFAPTVAVSGLNGCFVFGAGVQVTDGFSSALFQLVGGCRVKQQFCPIIVPLKHDNHNLAYFRILYILPWLIKACHIDGNCIFSPTRHLILCY